MAGTADSTASTMAMSVVTGSTVAGPLYLWERAGVRGAYEHERFRSYAPLTRAARGLSQRERQIELTKDCAGVGKPAIISVGGRR